MASKKKSSKTRTTSKPRAKSKTRKTKPGKTRKKKRTRKKSTKKTRALSKMSAKQTERLAPSTQSIVASEERLQRKSRKQSHAPLTTHKARSQWFRDNAAWPLREAPVGQLVRERARTRRMMSPQPLVSDWILAGPSNVGGRMTSAVVHPTDPDVIWAGAAGGGVWHSTDAGASWQALWHQEESLNVGALAIDPVNPDIIYCGTGEANLSADSYPGVGLYCSVNAGVTWELLTRADPYLLPARIGTIAINPFDSNHLMVGGVGHYLAGQNITGGIGGLYESRDGGRNWTRYNFISYSEYRCHSIVFHPTEAGRILATVSEQGYNSGIWRTDDNGATWVHLEQGLPSSERFNRTTLAVSIADPNRVYALASTNDSRVLGVFRSDDIGDTWQAVHGTAFNYSRPIGGGFSDQLERQMTYNNTIAVSPFDADQVICGGVDLHLSTDGGEHWDNVTIWNANPGDTNYAHADQHCLVYAPSDANRVYALNDGGMDVSDDGGATWTNRSDGLSVTMFYDYDVAQTNSNYYGGGAQDNGTQLTVNGQVDDHFDITGGDGGWLVFDPQNENHIYASIYNMNLYRFPASNGGNQFENVTPTNTAPGERESMWMVYITIDPTDSNTVFTGTRRVWRTQDDGTNWSPVSHYFRGQVSAIHISPADTSRIYVGTSYGEVFRSLDGGDTWSENLASAILPGFKVTRLASRPDNPDSLIATVANFGRSHVYRSDDGALTWIDIDRGVLPDVPHNAVVIPQQFPDEIYVANDIGVFRSTDFGVTWVNISMSLPNVSVIDLIYHDTDNTLTAATYGRSAWRIHVR